MLRSSLLVVAILLAGASQAQTSDPQAAAPVVYGATPLTVENCDRAPADNSSGDGCVAREQAPIDDGAIAYDSDYVPDYWEEAPVYDAAPVYLGISLIPDYWGWPYYGYGYGYGYGWPYYGFGFGWPYYGYAGYWGGAYWGGYWGGGYWHGHDHHGGGDHGDWSHNGGGHDGGHGHHGDYHGPYRYEGHGRYADQGGGSGGHGSPPAGAATRTMTASNSTRGTTTPANFTRGGVSTTPNVPRAGGSPDNRTAFAGTPAGVARTSATATSQYAGANRFAGRAPLPSSSYYAASRGAGAGAGLARNAPGGAATNYRGNTGSAYAYGRAESAASNRGANTSYRVTSVPSRNYAPATRSYNLSSNRGGAVARPGGNVTAQNYGGSRTAYPQQRYAPSNRAYNAGMPAHSGARGTASSYYAARGPMPSHSGVRGGAPSYAGSHGAMPSYARGGSGATASHGGGGHAGSAAAQASSGSHSGNAHGH